jgi:thiamine pyrophosphate-dependent acetolactate synthase large subunit-like protein
MDAVVEAESCGAAMVRLLEAYGVDTVFGIPGVHTLELYRGLAGSAIRHVTPRHEQGAAFMADGYARATGRPGVCVLITGPGLTNAATGIGQAFSDSVPMLVITSVAERRDLGMRRGRLHEIVDQRATIAPLCAFSHTLLSADELPLVLARAFAVFASQRPRPVHIEIPLDVITEPLSRPARALPLPGRPAPEPDAGARAAALLAGARAPMIFAGGGAEHAAAEVRRLAERIDAPVVTTVAGKGIMPEGHPLSLGSLLDVTAITDAVGAADVALIVGSELSETDFWWGVPDFTGAVIRIDLDPAVIMNGPPTEVAILADAVLTLDAILAALPGPPARRSGATRVAALLAGADAGLTPLRRKHVRTLDALRAALPDDAQLYTDMTQIAYTGNSWFRTGVPGTWHHPSGFGTLGYALPAAIGAKVARPETAIVALAGDGGLLFTVQELASAAELGLPLPVIVWHNDGYGQIRDGMIERGIQPIGVSIQPPDFPALARAFRCHAAVPQDRASLIEAVRTALSADRPTLIEVREDSAWLEA